MNKNNKKKDFMKIRLMLDFKKYELVVNPNNENEWYLYKVETNVLENPIMASETHTYKDLYKFAKEHYVPDLGITLAKITFFLLLINLILVFVNIYWLKSDIIRGYIYGNDIFALVQSLIISNIGNKKYNLMKKEFKEKWGIEFGEPFKKVGK